MINTQILADSHIHTYHSHDSRSLFSEYCDAAIEREISIITVTDHCDIAFCRSESNCDNVKLSAEEAKIYDEKMGDRLTVISGVELGDGVWNTSLAQKVATYDGFDVILGSIHSVAYKQYGMAFSGLNFSSWKQEDLNGYMEEYFNEIMEMILSIDFNVLSHLTVPLRYINGRYGNCLDIEPFYEIIEKILGEIIQRGIALEVNTSSFAALGSTMPDDKILRIYKELGGKLITLGSDSHSPVTLGSSFNRTLELLKSLGFEKYFYVKNKKFLPINII